MKNKNMKSILAVAMATVMSVGLVACSQPAATTSTPAEEAPAGGVLRLTVNPDIAISFDGDGKVTELEGRNDDGNSILEAYEDFKDKECETVAAELVEEIGAAGYFKPDKNGKINDIVITIEEGSELPDDTFIDDVAAAIRVCVSDNKWHSPLNVEGESDYDMTDYVDTDYGTGNDGNTDYGKDTDYGTGNDGNTDYGKDSTDYGDNSDGATDYNDATDYGKDSDGVTDFSDYGTASSNKKPAASNNSNYNDSNYDSNTNYDDDGDSDYSSNKKPAASKPSTSKPSTSKPSTSKPSTSKPSTSKPSTSNSDYGDSGYDSNSNYDSNSGYDSNSNYDSDSGYDD